jgi:tetratricopeptide (TPR) repeat protein
MAKILTSNLSHVSALALMLGFLLLIVQCGPSKAPTTKVQTETAQPPELRELLHQGNGFYRSGEYLRAIRIYEKGYAEAKRLGSMQSAVKFLHNLGSAHYAMFHYREAIQAYLQARDAATALGNQETLVTLSTNLSSLYLQMEDVEAARESAEQGLKFAGSVDPKYKAELLIHYARIRRLQKDSATAIALSKEAIDASKKQKDASTEAQAWDALGNALFERG